MEASTQSYIHSDSIERMKEILNSSDASYEDRKSVPTRSELTFNNGFYVYCSAIFIDLRGSKSLTSAHTRPVLAKIYKCYVSELIATLRSHNKIKEIYIEGDCVWAIIDTPYKEDIDTLINTSAKCASLIDTLNVLLRKKKYTELNAGIGLSYGESLVIKAGYKGSGINEIVWLGKLVGEAADLCSKASRLFTSRIFASNTLVSNINEVNKKLFHKDYANDCYCGNFVDTEMNEWVESQ